MAVNKNPIRRTSQAMDNASFDDTFEQNTQEILGYDGSALQRIKTDTDGKLQVDALMGLEIPAHDYIALTYVAAGDGEGEIETVTYKTGGAGGTTVATLTLAYNAANEIATVTKT